MEGGVAAASRDERERERHEIELVVESLSVEMRGDRERERPEKEWRRGRRENGRRGHGGGDGFRRRVWRDESENVEGMRVFLFISGGFKLHLGKKNLNAPHTTTVFVKNRRGMS